ncbi:histidine kinase [Burkholderia lata]|uniref:histidine kinase n=1 Tax=Burkholderia lata (strain ATCC 17760 / DSM 23089 / LMG 22485 / NCIMB 9086 / R18194 / 383) TaxID=482957 RepID=A0A6P2YH03_BURL3|nr:HAMP domain-containing sensor histidine kinase [Burkholderia lata]VWD21271.1 histidine kinase [Burkholderia lata]
MNPFRTLSITQRISVTLIGTLIAVAIASGLLSLAYFLQGEFSGYAMDERIDSTILVAVTRTSDGRLALQGSPQLDALERGSPALWFVVRDRSGDEIRFGRISPACESAVAVLPRLSGAGVTDFSERGNLSCKIKSVRTDLGETQIAYGGGPLMPVWKAAGLAVLQYLEAPFFLPLLLVNIVAIPVVVAMALRKLKDIARLARYVDIDRPGLRLPDDGLPREIAPLVRAFNAALERLDAGRAQHDRFIANAAHELRTPVAIIRARLDALESGPLKSKLEQDVARLGELTDALLDLQALKNAAPRMESLNLVALVRDSLADLAPVVLTAGHDVELVNESERLDVFGDPASLRRVIVNLVENATRHGGGSITLTVTLRADPTHVHMEFVDTGPGIPPAWRDQIFESFSRYTRHGPGAGLGLSIVREIALIHRGRASYFEPPTRGTGIRVSLPLAEAGTDPNA